MKTFLLKGLVAILLCISVAYAFTTDEVEMFKLQLDLVEKYGEKITFYKLLKVDPSSNTKQITKQFKKLSKKYHPDKNPKYRKLYERLNMATNMLTNIDTRKSYDYYVKNGFPQYDYHKGGFYFANRLTKYSQNIIILVMVSLAITFIQRGMSKLTYTSNVRRLNSFIQQCKEMDDTNGLGSKRLQFQESPDAEPKEILIKFGDVYVLENLENGLENATQTLISADTIPKPSWKNIWFLKLFNVLLASFKKKESNIQNADKKMTKKN